MIVVLLIVAIGGRWYLLRIAPDAKEPVGTALADYTLTTFTLKAMDEAGMPSFSVAGPFLRENSQDGSAIVDEPRIQLFQSGASTWSATAEEGWIAGSGDELRLTGNVVMSSPSDQKNARIDAETLRVRPQERTASSDDQVRVTRPGVELSGLGVDLDMKTQSIVLRSRVKARYGTGVTDASR